IFNLGGVLEGEGYVFFKAELNTYQKIFKAIRVFKIDKKKSDDEVQNIVIVGKKASSETSTIVEDKQLEKLLSRKQATDFPNGNEILTDDLAPVEYFNSHIPSN
ncbi:MAG: hypothetical protein HKN25_09375, partial [Pyrinomonadaceae bacterium]|nr:hypothetical protein [Pyrinomonadaceae bacterium]